MLRLWLAGAVLSLPTVVLADTAYLSNGDRITGTVDSIAGGKLIIDTEYAGSLVIDISAVRAVDSGTTLELRLESGNTITGRLVAPEQEQQVVIGDHARALAISEIAMARENNQAGNAFTRTWESRATVGAALSRGNSDTGSYNTLILSTLRHGRIQHDVSLLLDTEHAEDETVKDQLDLDYGFKWFYRDDWFVAGNAEYFQDRLKDINSRTTLGGGLGHQFWDNSLSAELGVSQVFEEIDDDNQSNPALRWALDYNRFLWSKRVELFHSQSILKILGGGRGEVIQASTGLRFGVSERLSTDLRVDVQHETQPPDERGETDVTYVLGVGFRF